jgi:chromosome segregation protein
VRFTKLRLNGFKSFVDPTDLVIHDGLTGVVGPNGCGKSNLLEALRWVMGENRPTAMRGGGMEDVIFNGAATRGARHFAEVALVCDTEGAALPGLVAAADGGALEVVRRIERGAGSAYRANGQDVRARDVALIFADAATGAHSPALVSQGKVAGIIAAKPQDDRGGRRVHTLLLALHLSEDPPSAACLSVEVCVFVPHRCAVAAGEAGVVELVLEALAENLFELRVASDLLRQLFFDRCHG